MGTLIVRHVEGAGGDAFHVEYFDGKRNQITTEPAVVASPVGFPVEGRPNSDLKRELRWYLESFLDYPYSPETEHADNIRVALKNWGEAAFAALFGASTGRDLYNKAVSGGLADLRIQVASDA